MKKIILLLLMVVPTLINSQTSILDQLQELSGINSIKKQERFIKENFSEDYLFSMEETDRHYLLPNGMDIGICKLARKDYITLSFQDSLLFKDLQLGEFVEDGQEEVYTYSIYYYHKHYYGFINYFNGRFYSICTK